MFRTMTGGGKEKPNVPCGNNATNDNRAEATTKMSAETILLLMVCVLVERRNEERACEPLFVVLCERPTKNKRRKKAKLLTKNAVGRAGTTCTGPTYQPNTTNQGKNNNIRANEKSFVREHCGLRPCTSSYRASQDIGRCDIITGTTTTTTTTNIWMFRLRIFASQFRRGERERSTWSDDNWYRRDPHHHHFGSSLNL